MLRWLGRNSCALGRMATYFIERFLNKFLIELLWAGVLLPIVVDVEQDRVKKLWPSGRDISALMPRI